MKVLDTLESIVHSKANSTNKTSIFDTTIAITLPVCRGSLGFPGFCLPQQKFEVTDGAVVQPLKRTSNITVTCYSSVFI